MGQRSEPGLPCDFRKGEAILLEECRDAREADMFDLLPNGLACCIPEPDLERPSRDAARTRQTVDGELMFRGAFLDEVQNVRDDIVLNGRPVRRLARDDLQGLDGELAPRERLAAHERIQMRGDRIPACSGAQRMLESAGIDDSQIHASSSTPRTAISPGTGIRSSRQASRICFPRRSLGAKTAQGLGSPRSHRASRGRSAIQSACSRFVQVP